MVEPETAAVVEQPLPPAETLPQFVQRVADHPVVPVDPDVVVSRLREDGLGHRYGLVTEVEHARLQHHLHYASPHHQSALRTELAGVALLRYTEVVTEDPPDVGERGQLVYRGSPCPVVLGVQ